jgi:tetratricopeptide (TPR) repeat protein
MTTETIRGTVEVSDPFVGVHEAVLAGVDANTGTATHDAASTLNEDLWVARSIRVRQVLLPTFRRTLGPPDLCVVYKSWRTVLASGSDGRANSTKVNISSGAGAEVPATSTPDSLAMEVTSGDLKSRGAQLAAWFHFVRGIWHRTPADAASYLGSLVKHGLEGASWYATGSYRIDRAACLAYNCFTNEDTVVEARFPGCTQVKRLRGPEPFHQSVANENGQPATRQVADTQDDENQWAQLFVSAVLRSVKATGEHPLYPALKVVATLDVAWNAEQLFLDAAARTLPQWKLAGSRFVDAAQATATCSIIAEGVWEYFARYARYQAAQDFFQTLATSCHEPALVLYVARSLMGQRQHQIAQKKLEELLLDQAACAELPGIDRLLLELTLAECELELGNLIEATDRIQGTVIPECFGTHTSPESSATGAAAQEERTKHLNTTDAVEASDEESANIRIAAPGELGRLACFLLARLYVQTGEYESALRSLNMADVEPPQMDWFLRQVTAPDSSPGIEGKTSKMRQLTQPRPGFAAGTDGVRVLARRLSEERIGAGAFGKGREQHHADRLLGDLTASVLSPEEREAFDILVKIVNQIGWDEFLLIRNRVFIMESDVLPLESAGTGALELSTASAEARPAPPHESPPQHSSTDNAEEPSLQTISLSSRREPATETQVHSTGTGPLGATQSDLDGHQQGEPKATLTLADARRQVHPAALSKALCTAWLDMLIHCLYEDLRAWSIWQHEESTLYESLHSNETTAAENAERAASPALVSESLLITETRRAPVDWLRRGELAERLGRPEMAERAYRICLGVAERAQTPTLTVWFRLAALQTEHGEAPAVVQALDHIWQYLVEHTDDSGKSTLTTRTGRLLPETMQAVLCHAVARFGFQTVRAAVSTLRQHQERMRSLLLDAVAAQVHGYDR